MKRYLSFLILIISNVSVAQQIVVNADGTHSTVHSTGNGAGVIVNPNGTHSTIHSAGNGTGVIVNPDGTHSTIHSSGNGSGIIVNPNGTHSTFHSAGKNMKVIVNANGTHPTVYFTDSSATPNLPRQQTVDPASKGTPLKRWEPRRLKEEPTSRKRKE